MKLQWTIKGLAPEVIEAARKAAQDSGMTQAAWLERAILAAAEPERKRLARIISQVAEAQALAFTTLRASGLSVEEASRLAADSTYVYSLLYPGR